jgi:hypothetical protein
MMDETMVKLKRSDREGRACVLLHVALARAAVAFTRRVPKIEKIKGRGSRRLLCVLGTQGADDEVRARVALTLTTTTGCSSRRRGRDKKADDE